MEKKNKQFKIEFDKSNSLKKSNKNKFIQISNYQFEKKIEDIILQSIR